jgi:CheY-like chemotaxis protein
MTTAAGRKILFIDDDPYVSSAYVGLLESVGFEVNYVRSVKRALRAAEEDRDYDAVVIDIMMPPGTFFDRMETMGGYRTGIPLAREMLELQPMAAIIALTNRRDADVEAWFTMRPAI